MMLEIRKYCFSGTLAVWGTVLCYFYFSDRIGSYLHPSFHIWTAVSGIVLLLMAFGTFFFPLTAECCDGDCVHPQGPKGIVGMGICTLVLVFPLLMTTAVSPSQFGATAVMNRGMIDNIGDLPGYEPYVEPPLPTADGSVGPAGDPVDTGSYLLKNDAGQIQASTVDLLYAAQEATMRKDFENKEVEVVGQYMPARANNPSGDRFSLVRMFIMCCAADARPVAITVQTKAPENLPDMSWVKVTGKATFPIEGGKQVPVIVADQIVPCDPPPESFIY